MRIGSLFSGYGGLDMAVESVFPGAAPAWFCEWDEAPSKVLATHWLDVTNHRDVTTIDWATMPPVDIITGGYPCQPFSAAGRREGTNDERHLWPYVREAVRVLRPRYVVLENVAGHRSLGFDRVLGDMAEDGLDVRWTSVRASDIGAPHHRERLFIIATPADAKGGSGRFWDGNDVRAGRGEGQQQPGARRGGTADTGGAAVGQFAGGSSTEEAGAVDGDGLGHSGGEWAAHNGREGASDASSLGSGERVQSLVGGIPAAAGGGSTDASPDPHGVRGEDRRLGSGTRPQLARPGGGDLPLPDTNGLGRIGGRTAPEQASGEDATVGGHGTGIEWGAYAPAVRRWEHLTRPAPAPTEPNTKGKPRLNAAFAEWMMGLPEGHVTGVDIPRTAQLKAIGNGVCPQQAVAALLQLLSVEAVAA